MAENLSTRANEQQASDGNGVRDRALRTVYCGAVLLFLLLAVYGSLVPLRLRPMPLSDALREFASLAAQRPSAISRSDLIVNVLLFVPIGFFMLAALTGRRKSSPARLLLLLVAVQATCLAASVLIELSQIWFERRTASLLDIGAQMVGTLVGMISWCALGKEFNALLRGGAAGREKSALVLLLWGAYTLAVGVYQWLPLDFTIRPAELAAKYKRGLVHLRPFSEAQGLELASTAVSHAAAYVPVGVLALLALRGRTSPGVAGVLAFLLGTAAGGVIFAVELLAVSATSKTSDLITGACGVALGVAAAHWWRHVSGDLRDPPPAADASSQAARGIIYLGVAAAYAAVLVILFCAPFELTSDTTAIKERLHGFFRPPLTSLYHGHITNAVKEVARKVLLFAPLGIFLALGATSMTTAAPRRKLLIAAALLCSFALALGIELFQVVLVNHVPDATDVGLCTFGAAAGVSLVLRHQKRRGGERD